MPPAVLLRWAVDAQGPGAEHHIRAAQRVFGAPRPRADAQRQSRGRRALRHDPASAAPRLRRAPRHQAAQLRVGPARRDQAHLAARGLRPRPVPLPVLRRAEAPHRRPRRAALQGRRRRLGQRRHLVRARAICARATACCRPTACVWPASRGRPSHSALCSWRSTTSTTRGGRTCPGPARPPSPAPPARHGGRAGGAFVRRLRPSLRPACRDRAASPPGRPRRSPR